MLEVKRVVYGIQFFYKNYGTMGCFICFVFLDFSLFFRNMFNLCSSTYVFFNVCWLLSIFLQIFVHKGCKHFIHCKFSQVTEQSCICCKIGTKEIEGRMFRKGSQKSNQLGHQLGWMAPIQERQTLLLRWID